jgi:DNA polymerase-3 subunit delta'
VKKKNIQIEKIRELQRNMNLSSYSGKIKAAIIDDAELMTVAAQNALLKTLEEPPENSIFILICHDEEKILPTVKSRCTIKRFNPVSEKEISSCISRENRDEIISWSFGRPGLAIELAKNSEALKKYKAFKSDLESLAEINISEKFTIAENLSKNVPLLLETLDIWSALLRKKIVSGNILPSISKKRALVGINLIEKSAALIRNTNSNVRLILENLLLNF